MPLPGARDCSAFRGRNSRPQHACKKFLGVRATASCPPPTRQSLPVVLVLHGAVHRQAGRKVIVYYSVCGEWHAERPCGVEPWRRVRHERNRRDLNIGFARWRDPTKRNVGFSPFPFFLRKNGNFPLHFHSFSTNKVTWRWGYVGSCSSGASWLKRKMDYLGRRAVARRAVGTRHRPIPW